MVSTVNYIFFLVFVSCYGVQDWSLQPSGADVNPGENVTLHCIIRDKAGDCRWEKDGTPVGMFHDKYVWSRNISLGDCSISILHAEREYDHGKWQCSVTATSLRSRDALVSKEVQLRVRKPPARIILRQGDTVLYKLVQVVEGVNTTLTCVGEGGDPPPSLKWRLPESINHVSMYEDDISSLLTVSVDHESTGQVLVCEASHPTLTQPILASLRLDVLYVGGVSIECEINGSKPSLITSHSTLTLQEGDSLILRCLALGNPQPRVVWRRENYLEELDRDEKLVFLHVHKEDRGIFSCRAQNQIGISGPYIIQIDVEYATSVVSTVPSISTQAMVGSTLTFQCSGDGNPSPLYQWSQIFNSQRKIRGNEKNLKMSNVSWSDSGDYICTASNAIGGVERHSDSSPVSFQVYGAPEVYVETALLQADLKADVKLEISFCAHPRPDVKWILGNLVISPGSRHGRYIADVLSNLQGFISCFKSVVYILEAQEEDENTYNVYVENIHGSDKGVLQLSIQESDYLLGMVAGVVAGALLILLLLILVIHIHTCCKHSSSTINHEKLELESAGIFLTTAYTQDTNCYDHSPKTFNTFKRGLKSMESELLTTGGSSSSLGMMGGVSTVSTYTNNLAAVNMAPSAYTSNGVAVHDFSRYELTNGGATLRSYSRPGNQADLRVMKDSPAVRMGVQMNTLQHKRRRSQKQDRVFECVDILQEI